VHISTCRGEGRRSRPVSLLYTKYLTVAWFIHNFAGMLEPCVTTSNACVPERGSRVGNADWGAQFCTDGSDFIGVSLSIHTIVCALLLLAEETSSYKTQWCSNTAYRTSQHRLCAYHAAIVPTFRKLRDRHLCSAAALPLKFDLVDHDTTFERAWKWCYRTGPRLNRSPQFA
jgi:hypothetical protein